MLLEEFHTKDEYSSVKNDHEVPRLSDLRKTKLSLGQINRMRLIRDVRNYELKSNLENIRKQYSKANSQQQGPF